MPIFRLTVNWYGEQHVLHTSSSSRTKALTNTIRQLAKKLDRNYASVRAFVLDGKDRYDLKEVPKKGAL